MLVPWLIKQYGVLKLIIRAWVKFNGIDVECICTGSRRAECGPDFGCAKYVVKFVPIMSVDDNLEKVADSFSNTLSKTTREIEKVNKKIRRIM